MVNLAFGCPSWSHDVIICTGESYKNVVKPTFSKGASPKDPADLSLDGNARRAIDIHEGKEVDESVFKAPVRQAVALNSYRKFAAVLSPFETIRLISTHCLRRQLWLASAEAPRSPGSIQPGFGPLFEPGSLEFSKCADHLHHYSSGGSFSVDRLGQRIHMEEVMPNSAQTSELNNF